MQPGCSAGRRSRFECRKVALHGPVPDFDFFVGQVAPISPPVNRGFQRVLLRTRQRGASGRVGLAIVIEPPVSPLLTTVKVDEAPFYIAMAEDDRLARYPFITMDMLGGRCWSLFERRMHPPLYAKVLRFAGDSNVKVTKITM